MSDDIGSSDERLFSEARKLESLFDAAHGAEQAIERVLEAVGEALASDEAAVQEQARYVIERLQRMLAEAL